MNFPENSPAIIRLLGMDFADFHPAQAASWLSLRPSGAPFGYVVTPNADHLVRVRRQPELIALYGRALLRLLDSRVVARAARGLGLPAPSVTPGSDLTGLILRCHLEPGERITVIGVHPDHLPALIRRNSLAPPAHYNPPRGFGQQWRTSP